MCLLKMLNVSSTCVLLGHQYSPDPAHASPGGALNPLSVVDYHSTLKCAVFCLLLLKLDQLIYLMYGAKMATAAVMMRFLWPS